MPARHLRIALIAAALLVTTNGPLLFFVGRVIDHAGFPPPWEDGIVRPFLLTFAALTAVLVLGDHRSAPLRGHRLPHRIVALAIVAFPLWAITSSIWGERPELTFWRSLIYVGLAFLALAVAALDDRDLAWTLGVATAAAVGVSTIVVLGWSDVGINRDDFWQGIYTNPNSLGPIAALGVLAGVGLWSLGTTPSVRLPAAGLVGMSTLALYQSTSRTSWFALAIAIGAATAVIGSRLLSDRVGRRRAAIIAGPIVAIGGLATIGGLWLRWDDPTFAQRRTIWRGSWDFMDERWFQGYGFFSFFEVPGRATAYEYFDRGSAHSSFVEVMLGLGIVGLALFVVIVGAAVSNTVRDAWRRPNALSWMRLAVVTFLVFENLTESFILWFSYNWVILCAAALRRPSAVTEPAPEQRTNATQHLQRSTPR